MSFSKTYSNGLKTHAHIQKLTFNLLHFRHPASQFTFWFTDTPSPNLYKIHKLQVPDEVIQHFGLQEHYYTSFQLKKTNFFPVTKNTIPDIQSDQSNSKSHKIPNSAFSLSLLRRYYNHQIFAWFQRKNQMVKPSFVNDIEIWLHTKIQNSQYWIFDKFRLKIQFAKITNNPELIVSYAGQSKIFRQNVAQLLQLVSPVCFNWVVHNRRIYKFDDLPENVKQNLNKVYPVWNFNFRDQLNQKTNAPDKSNKYIKYRSKINNFFNNWLNTPEFKTIIPISSTSFESVPAKNINEVNPDSNLMVFGNHKHDLNPYNGMKNGPFKSAGYSKIQFFYIFHQNDKDVTYKLDEYFKYGLMSFKGLYNFTKVPYFTQPNFSIVFSKKEDPLPEIESKLYSESKFNPDLHYMAIYVSPYHKSTTNSNCNKVYYRIKELLLERGITSQVIDAEKVRNAINKNERYDWCLNNIGIAILAKLNGIPWQLKTRPRNDLIIGVGAFKSKTAKIQYLGSAFCFSNNGQFNQFECFRKDQIDELAGLILWQIRKFVDANKNLTRLIIHFYKNMSKKELDPIENGLNNLGLRIPVFIVAVNKSESQEITAFDDNSPQLMPISGTFIKIGCNRYLLFNNTRYQTHASKKSDGYPFPIKISITCSHKEKCKEP